MKQSTTLIFAILSVTILASSCGKIPAYREAEKIKIYSLFCSSKLLLIESNYEVEHVIEHDWEWVKKNIPDLDRDTWENFIAYNPSAGKFPPDLELGCDYVLIRPEEENSLLSMRGGISANYPESEGVIIGLSDIGFNSSGNRALLTVSKEGDYHYCSLDLYFFEKSKGEWLVSEILNMVIC